MTWERAQAHAGPPWMERVKGRTTRDDWPNLRLQQKPCPHQLIAGQQEVVEKREKDTRRWGLADWRYHVSRSGGQNRSKSLSTPPQICTVQPAQQSIQGPYKLN
ncbi:hypothetical protein DPEC_G00065930 [Dallia pectoralis]|uniref:Uncharacterized protein n=1 Tax=Dallia pectoralis TaxID=75939 RepID=A0ACC2H9D8_DALPE|nr:hypothetical protein DPEC_G00065930 [Dallia pectoralis]